MNSIAPIPIFDTHAHLDFPEYEADRDAILRRLQTGTFPGGLVPEELDGQPIEVVGVLIPGVTPQKSIARPKTQSPTLFYAVGIHPNYTAVRPASGDKHSTAGSTSDSAESDWQYTAELARQDGIAAIGETGLDYHWKDAPPEVQIDMFHRHIALSHETGKPLLIHCRDAWEDLLPILQQSGKLHGILHAFSGSAEQMWECVELGLHISFAGSVTYRNAKFSPLWEAARQTPLDRLLIETDAPFMAPHPYRGKLQRNEPTLAALTALRLAELRGDSLRTIAEATAANAFRLLTGSSPRPALPSERHQANFCS